MMEAERLRVLHDLDLHAPWILDEPDLDEAWHRTERRDNLDARSLPLLHLRVEIGEREADVVDGGVGARLCSFGFQPDEARLAEEQPVLAFRRRLAAEHLLIPLDGFGLIGRRQMN